MHLIIYAVVPAEQHEDALGHANYVFDRLTGAAEGYSSAFDYYVTFDEDGHDVAGAGRWGDRPTVVNADSDQATEWVTDAIEATRDDLTDTLDNVAAAINAGDSETLLINDKFQYNCARLGRRRGYPLRVYDEDGQGIRSLDRFKRIRDNHETADTDLWVVPADVHF